MTGSQNDERFLWLVTANVDQAGTKHFSPGTKVFLHPPLWHGLDRVHIMARHRSGKGRGRFVQTTVKSSILTNFRVQKVYQPNVIRQWGHMHLVTGKHWEEALETRKFLRGMERARNEAAALGIKVRCDTCSDWEQTPPDEEPLVPGAGRCGSDRTSISDIHCTNSCWAWNAAPPGGKR